MRVTQFGINEEDLRVFKKSQLLKLIFFPATAAAVERLSLSLSQQERVQNLTRYESSVVAPEHGTVMGEQLQQQLKDVGSKLENPPPSKDDLVILLKVLALPLAACLSRLLFILPSEEKQGFKPNSLHFRMFFASLKSLELLLIPRQLTLPFTAENFCFSDISIAVLLVLDTQ